MNVATRSRALGLLGVVALAASACGGRDLGPTGAAGVAPSVGAAGGASGGAALPGAAGTGGTGAVDAGPFDGAASPGGNSATLPDGRCVRGAFKRDGVCRCQALTPNVCGGACVDLTVDPGNCGGCGHVCAATSTCNAGQCGPSVSNLVPAAPGCMSLQLAVAGGILYWTDRGHGTVKAVPLGGPSPAAPITIATGEKGPTLIEVRGSTVFWIDVVSSGVDADTDRWMTTSRLRRAVLPGAPPIDLATRTNESGGIRGLAISKDGQTLYFATDTRVMAMPAAGGTPVEVGHEAHNGVPTALGIDGDIIGYVSDLNGNVDAITVKGGSSATCGGDNPDPNGPPLMMDCVRVGGCTPDAVKERFIVRGTKGYWADGTSVLTGSLVGGPVNQKQLVTNTVYFGRATGLALAEDAIYFAEDGTFDSSFTSTDRGTIERAPVALGAEAIAIARGQEGAHAMAVDANNLYWATKDCAINTLPR